jgi:hypothetical protein
MVERVIARPDRSQMAQSANGDEPLDMALTAVAIA